MLILLASVWISDFRECHHSNIMGYLVVKSQLISGTDDIQINECLGIWQRSYMHYDKILKKFVSDQ